MHTLPYFEDGSINVIETRFSGLQDVVSWKNSEYFTPLLLPTDSSSAIDTYQLAWQPENRILITMTSVKVSTFWSINVIYESCECWYHHIYYMLHWAAALKVDWISVIIVRLLIKIFVFMGWIKLYAHSHRHIFMSVNWGLVRRGS